MIWCSVRGRADLWRGVIFYAISNRRNQTGTLEGPRFSELPHDALKSHAARGCKAGGLSETDDDVKMFREEVIKGMREKGEQEMYPGRAPCDDSIIVDPANLYE